MLYGSPPPGVKLLVGGCMVFGPGIDWLLSVGPLDLRVDVLGAEVILVCYSTARTRSS